MILILIEVKVVIALAMDETNPKLAEAELCCGWISSGTGYEAACPIGIQFPRESYYYHGS